jgi:hypothetical protein
MGEPWFTISLGIVVGVMMVSYVAVPSRLIGAKPPKQSRRDELATTAVGGALSATVCTPPYVLGRLGILMLGSSAVLVFILGIFAVSLGVTLRAGATEAVSAIRDERHRHRGSAWRGRRCHEQILTEFGQSTRDHRSCHELRDVHRVREHS